MGQIRVPQRKPAVGQVTYPHLWSQDHALVGPLGTNGGPLNATLTDQIEANRGSGFGVEAGARRDMEAAFGHHFERVRVHTSDTADSLNRSLGSIAFTSVGDVFFRHGAYQPYTDAGRRLLAHELTHTLQQEGGLHGMATSSPARLVTPSHDPSEQQAEHAAAQIGTGTAPVTTATAAVPPGAVQRLAEEAARPATDAGKRRTFRSARFAADVALEACLNDQGRLHIGNGGASVRKVQQALLDVGIALPTFGADAKYGEETAHAVTAFKIRHGLTPTFGDVGPMTMSTLDDIFAGPSPTPPGPPVPVPPVPTPTPPGPVPAPVFNPELEDTMDAMANSLQFVLLARRDGLDQLAAQLRKDDVVEQATKGTVATTLSDSIKGGLKNGVDALAKVVSSGVGVLVTAGFDAGIASIATAEALQLFAPPDDSGHASFPASEIFIEAQKKAVNDHAFRVQQDFLTKADSVGGDPTQVADSKPNLRQMEQTTPGSGVAKAQADLKDLDNDRTAGEKTQFDSSLVAWAAFLAQRQLGIKEKGNPDSDILTAEGTDLGKLASDTKGVIEVPAGENYAFFTGSVEQQTPHLLRSSDVITLQGVTGNLLNRLQSDFGSINDTHLPFFVKGTLTWTELDDAQQVTRGPLNLEILLGINEDAVVFNLKPSSDLLHYLRIKANGGKDAPNADDGLEQKGAQALLTENIGTIPLSSVTLRNQKLDV